MKILLALGLVMISNSAWSESTRLSCVQDSIDVCKDAQFQLAPIGKDEFAKMFEVRRQKFTEWMKPVALYAQAATGLPASALITQAGVASDWGGSPAFRNHNNIFKHMCWASNKGLSGEIEMGGRAWAYKGSCGVEKTLGQIGRPIHFANREESVLAYLSMLLFSPSKYYKGVQEELKRGRKSTPIRMPNFRNVVDLLGVFSFDDKYVSILRHIIQQEKLTDLDNFTCWKCLLPPKPPPEGSH